MKVGDKAYLVYEDCRRPSCEVTVVSIGNKYITVDGVHRTESRYDILTKESIDDQSGWNCRARLYESREKYVEQQLEDIRVNEIKQRIIYVVKNCAIEPKLLYTIARLLKIEIKQQTAI